MSVQRVENTSTGFVADNTVLAAGSIGQESDTGRLKIGDGSTAWNDADYFIPDQSLEELVGLHAGVSAANAASGGRPAALNSFIWASVGTGEPIALTSPLEVVAFGDADGGNSFIQGDDFSLSEDGTTINVLTDGLYQVSLQSVIDYTDDCSGQVTLRPYWPTNQGVIDFPAESCVIPILPQVDPGSVAAPMGGPSNNWVARILAQVAYPIGFFAAGETIKLYIGAVYNAGSATYDGVNSSLTVSRIA